LNRNPIPARAGFTLIEVMAVVVVIGLVMGLVVPNFAARRGAELEESARLVADALHIARERAIVTGAAHRALLDLEVGTTRIDWHVDESRAFAHLSRPGDDLGRERSDDRAFSLSPPENEERNYFPIPNRFGREEWLPENIFFVGANTPDGWIEDGTVQIVFQVDGSTDYAEIVLRDNWENRVILEVQPLLEIVRIRKEEAP
jgi:prepilin-type N-terminal cleavage/methylation domain-containing protein